MGAFLRAIEDIMEDKREIKGLEQAVDEVAGSGWYRKEIDKFLRGAIVVGTVTGSVLAMYGHQTDKDLMEGFGYGILMGDSMIGGSILAEMYLRNYFSKAKAGKATAEK